MCLILCQEERDRLPLGKRAAGTEVGVPLVACGGRAGRSQEPLHHGRIEFYYGHARQQPDRFAGSGEVSRRVGSPECRPIRTRTATSSGQAWAESARCAATQHETAAPADWNTT